jgi:hypothetical protein
MKAYILGSIFGVAGIVVGCILTLFLFLFGATSGPSWLEKLGTWILIVLTVGGAVGGWLLGWWFATP